MLKLNVIYNLKEQLNNIPHSTDNIEYCCDVNCLDTLVSGYINDYTFVTSVIIDYMELYNVDDKTLKEKFIKPMTEDFMKSLSLLAHENPQKLVNLLQLILNGIDTLIDEKKLKLTGIYNLKQQLNSIPDLLVNFYEFYNFNINCWRKCNNMPFKHPNGWVINIKPRDCIDKNMSFDDFKMLNTRVNFGFIDNEKKERKLTNNNVWQLYHLVFRNTDTMEYAVEKGAITDEKYHYHPEYDMFYVSVLFDDCYCGLLEKMFEWFNTNKPSILIDYFG